MNKATTDWVTNTYTGLDTGAAQISYFGGMG